MGRWYYFARMACCLLFSLVVLNSQRGQAREVRPFSVNQQHQEAKGVRAQLTASAFEELSEASVETIELPVSQGRSLLLEVERFEILSPTASILINGQPAPSSLEPSDVILYRGQVIDEPGSDVYIAVSRSGLVNGYVFIPGDAPYFVATPPQSLSGSNATVQISQGLSPAAIPDQDEFCGVDAEMTTDEPRAPQAPERLEPAGIRVATVGLLCDHEFVGIFGNITFAAEYAVELMAAASAIYMRDLEVKLQVGHLELWGTDGEPWVRGSPSSAAQHLRSLYSPEEIQIAHVLTAARDLGFGGIATVGTSCESIIGSVAARLNGSFPLPDAYPPVDHWDPEVVTHEIGHNFGTLHTHDGYVPQIDNCAGGALGRGTIMSYCHIQPGYSLNVDLRFHRRVQAHIDSVDVFGACMWYDCNGNSIDDAKDISTGSSSDVNDNGIPDECEDCDGNGVFDPDDIAGGAPDLNSNGIPDACESDCNGNGIPDEYEIVQNTFLDRDGNNVPDECDPDCDGNGLADHIEIATALSTGSDIDVDRDGRPDQCQDCNGNFISDWLDLGRPLNWYSPQGNFIREFHGVSGVPTEDFKIGLLLSQPYDIVIGSDRRMYVASYGNDRVVRFDPVSYLLDSFVTSGSGGLDGPTSLALRESDSLLLVASFNTNSVLAYRSTDGLYAGEFIATGSGGLVGPSAITIGPQGDVFVAGSDNTVRRYSGTDGSFIGVFVQPGAGDLDGPRAMLFAPSGQLLVSSFESYRINEYDGVTGDFLQVFALLDHPWGMRIGPDGYLYVVRTGGEPWIIKFDLLTGLWGPLVRGAGAMSAPTGLAFMPESPDDCNRNWRPDSCDIAQGYSLDLDANGIPDECEVYDRDGDGIADSVDNCPDIASADTSDSDGDGIGDPCDACAGFDDALDSDRDGTPDSCDRCHQYADFVDSDEDGVPDGCDRCEGFDDGLDSDGDGSPDACDLCQGFDDGEDFDRDTVPDGCDSCMACEFSVVLDSISGLHNIDTVKANTPLQFHFHLRTNVAGEQLWSFAHSFVLYSPDGAEWQSPSIDSTAINWFAQFQDEMPEFSFRQLSADGSGRDTLIVEAQSGSIGKSLVENFDEYAFTISTRVGNAQAGKSLCLDTLSLLWKWTWQDKYTVAFQPVWVGSRCFAIVEGPCCEGITGNVDCDSEELIDIGDLTRLIDYLYISRDPLCCEAEANVDGDAAGLVDIGDLTGLIDYLYISNAVPSGCP
jgi:hypothetical protein